MMGVRFAAGRNVTASPSIASNPPKAKRPLLNPAKLESESPTLNDITKEEAILVESSPMKNCVQDALKSSTRDARHELVREDEEDINLERPARVVSTLEWGNFPIDEEVGELRAGGGEDQKIGLE
ncbi:unnamed protein product [Linum trigynum]|uniref:Uncharacterized protein n=1 Tax=Linum trigynum TaxID=586398 RepID=A0AAV2E0B8_9ROSI